MNQLNSIIIEGNLTRDVTFANKEKTVANCQLACNRFYKDKDGKEQTEVSYFEIAGYGRLAEILVQWGTKGKGLRVVGRLKQERWTDTDNKLHSKVIVVAEHIEFKKNTDFVDKDIVSNEVSF